MPIKYKIDILQALKDKGYNTNRIRKEKMIGEATLSHIRQGDMISMQTLGTICQLLDCQPSDIIEYEKN
jgi:putative transcriptional regulator